MGQTPDQDIPVSELIAIQRTLAGSDNVFERLVGASFVAGMLDIRLTQLTDRPIGQLMFDHFEHDVGILQPEMTTRQHAIRRLFRSAAGKLTAEDIVKQRQRPACPKCGNEMLLHYGIDQPDFLECAFVNCGCKELLNPEKESLRK